MELAVASSKQVGKETKFQKQKTEKAAVTENQATRQENLEALKIFIKTNEASKTEEPEHFSQNLNINEEKAGKILERNKELKEKVSKIVNEILDLQRRIESVENL